MGPFYLPLQTATVYIVRDENYGIEPLRYGLHLLC